MIDQILKNGQNFIRGLTHEAEIRTEQNRTERSSAVQRELQYDKICFMAASRPQ